MNALWWNQIRMQLGLERLSHGEAIDQYLAMPVGEIQEWVFYATYGRMDGPMHSFSDRDWWLSSISI